MSDHPQIALVKDGTIVAPAPRPGTLQRRLDAALAARDAARRLDAALAARDAARRQVHDLGQALIETDDARRAEKSTVVGLRSQARRLADAVGDAERQIGDLREEICVLRDKLGAALAAEATARFRAETLEAADDDAAAQIPGVSPGLLRLVIALSVGVAWAAIAALTVVWLWGRF